MIFPTTLTAILAGASLGTSVHALPRGGDDHVVASRQLTDPWTDYWQTSESFVQQGLCRYYLNRSYKFNTLELCERHCNEKSVSCVVKGDLEQMEATKALFTNPDGEKFAVGECMCGNEPIGEAIFDFVAEGLRESEGIICEVWLESFVASADILSTLVLPAGVSWKAFKTIWGLVKKADTFGGLTGIGGINDIITNRCGSDRISIDVVQMAFDAIKQIDIDQVKEFGS